MKKYLALFSAAILALGMVSCKDDNGGGGGGVTPPTPGQGITFTTASDAFYYGQKYGDDTNNGCFSFVLTNNEGDKLRIDCFGSKQLSDNNAKLTNGEYKLGTTEEHAPRTFFVAKAETDEAGTIYWKNDVASLITDGKMTVSPDGGATKIDIAFMAGETEINGSFSGTLKFEADIDYPPHEATIEAIDFTGNYYGDKSAGQTESGLFIVTMVAEGTFDAEMKSVRVLQFEGFMDLPENNLEATLPEGTYTINPANSNPEKYDTMEALTLNPGVLYQNTALGSVEFVTDELGQLSYGWLIKEGTLEVKYEGDNYVLTAKVKGQRSDLKASIQKEELEEFTYTYTGPREPMLDYADPLSNGVEGNINVGELTYDGILQAVSLKDNLGYDLTLWAYYLFGEGVEASVDNNNLDISGEGEMMIIALWGPNQSSTKPEGEFQMGPGFGLFYEDKNIAMPGNPTLSEGGISPNDGCWYTYIKRNGQVVNINQYAGAMPEKGFVKTSNEGNTHKMEFEFHDRYGHVITGSYAGEITILGSSTASASATSGNYIPTVPVNLSMLHVEPLHINVR